MTKAEFGILVKAMKAVYGDPKFLPDADAIMVWYEFFKDDDYMVVQAAIQKYMANNEFAPTVAGIRKNMVDKILPSYPLRTYKAIYDMELTSVLA